ncbi:TIGR02391 family protein [Rhodanobacter glycinis]|uniref:TIGR02391 family protein n=1 Tax=Rhodanobacter glycinis TaxID=582702 RepID=UPI001126EF81|nr:TIGR02391 family protein [Rhodanobacter glycinis]TPG50021.1 TIGR02391 family protein [Rhodanobacter glycinis]
MFEAFQIANMQYHGESGITQRCIDAVVRILQAGEWVTKAILLTHEHDHCLYLQLAEHEDILVRPGFTSGYEGEGPAGLAIVLLLLKDHCIEVEEVLVSARFMRRAAESRLTRADAVRIDGRRAIRPYRLSDYTWKVLDARGGGRACTRKQYSLLPPFGLLDPRLWDLALLLESDPDAAISKAFRLLEETVVRRCGFSGLFGRKVFEKAFLRDDSPLTWQALNPGEVRGRAELFTGAFSAHRNPRAHRRIDDDRACSLREFLLVNELFLLESEAVARAES